MNTYPGGVHPFANAFPMLSGVEFAELVESIEANGLHDKIIVTADGTLVDGRNRWAALDAIGTADYSAYTETLPEGTTEEQILELIVARNLHRRHLTASQKAMLATELEERFAAITKTGRKPTGQDALPQHEATSAARAAKLTGASESYVERAKRVQREAPELVEEIKSGKTTVNKAVAQLKERQKPLPDKEVVSEKSGKRLPTRKMEQSISSAMSTLSGLCLAISGVEELDPSISPGQRAEWFAELGNHIKSLNDFRRKLREQD